MTKESGVRSQDVGVVDVRAAQRSGASAVAAPPAVDPRFQDPRTIRKIYDRLDLELTAATEQRMRDFLTANPKGAHGVHHYTWDATGLDEGT